MCQSPSLTNIVQNSSELYGKHLETPGHQHQQMYSDISDIDSMQKTEADAPLSTTSGHTDGFLFRKCNGVIGVPISFLDKCCPEQFIILGFTGGIGWDDQNDIQTIKEYTNAKQHNPDRTITSGGKVNTGAAFLFKKMPNDRYYTATNAEGYIIRTYGRILIRRNDINHHDQNRRDHEEL